MNILFLTAYPPVLGMHGGGVRMHHNIRILGRKHEVHVVSFVESVAERERVEAISGVCASVRAVPRNSMAGGKRLSLAPSRARCFDTPAMRDAVDAVFRTHPIDVLQCEYVEMAQYRRRDAFTVWSVIDLLSPDLEQAFRIAPSPFEKARAFYRWRSTLNFESHAARSVDRVVTMTPEDAADLRRRAPGADVRDIPIGVDSAFYAPGERDDGLPLRAVFLGNFRHAPNLEAVCFLRDQVADAFPGIRFEVAGAGLPEDVLAGTSFHPLGYQTDTRGLYRSPNTIVVAPLFSGRGQRVKLLEAFSMGMPVVTTPLGAHGFPIRHREEAWIAGTADEFREGLGALRDSRELREAMGAKARRMIRDRFDWEVLAGRFLDVVERER